MYSLRIGFSLSLHGCAGWSSVYYFTYINVLIVIFVERVLEQLAYLALLIKRVHFLANWFNPLQRTQRSELWLLPSLITLFISVMIYFLIQAEKPYPTHGR